MNLIQRGDIWLINFRPDGCEGEAGQIHPGVTVTTNAANAHTQLVLALPLTSNTERMYVTNVILPNHRIGLVSDDLMSELDAILRRHMSL